MINLSGQLHTFGSCLHRYCVHFSIWIETACHYHPSVHRWIHSKQRCRGYQQSLLISQHPREYQARLTGFTGRALAAHLNVLQRVVESDSFQATEMFPQFAISVLFALGAQVPPLLVAKLAVFFLFTRLIYHVVMECCDLLNMLIPHRYTF